MEPQRPLPVLFTHFGDQWIRGSETLLLDLLRYLDRSRIEPIVWCNGLEMADACRGAGYLTHRTDFEYYLDAGSPPFSLRKYSALVREAKAIARRHDIAVLHANSAAPTQWLVPAARSLRLPVLTHMHIDYLRRSRYALLLHQADLLVGVSAQVLEGPIQDGVPESRTQVIYNGIDFKRLTAQPATNLRASLGIPVDVLTVGAVGSLIRRKGHDLLVRAMAAMAGETAPHLLVASDGPEREPLKKLAAELGVSDRVHFLGYHDPIIDLYETCDVIALASRADAFGLVLAEAGYCRRPVVATRVGGIPEVIVHEKTGLLVLPDDVEALVAAFTRLAENPGWRQELGEAGHARAVGVFSAERMAAEFHDTYERMARVPRRSLGWPNVPQRSGIYLDLLKGSSRAASPA
ncbi:MAG: glycosyltransferase family 4 protein [Alphaproteobacteria bacterium]|nr:glycosyltransferase family 4 protein [Alphaproteobacteria bacterium]